MQTIGHSARYGGLRGHSVGDIYPLMVVGKGTMDSLSWWIMDPTGESVGNPHGNTVGFASSSEAYTAAQLISKVIKHAD